MRNLQSQLNHSKSRPTGGGFPGVIPSTLRLGMGGANRKTFGLPRPIRWGGLLELWGSVLCGAVLFQFAIERGLPNTQQAGRSELAAARLPKCPSNGSALELF